VRVDLRGKVLDTEGEDLPLEAHLEQRELEVKGSECLHELRIHVVEVVVVVYGTPYRLKVDEVRRTRGISGVPPEMSSPNNLGDAFMAEPQS